MKEIEIAANEYQSEYLESNEQHCSVADHFKSGVEWAKSQSMSEWVSVAEHGLPTDNSIGYFIAKGHLFHKTLYKLSELIEKNSEYEITDYLPFRLPPPPQTSK